MEKIIKTAFDKVKASEDLKQKTIEYILHTDSAVQSVHIKPAAKRPIYLKRLVAAACAALILLALPIGGYALYKTPMSFVSVDINPSVELGINAFGKVVTVTAYNEDGEKVIEGLSLLNSNVQNAVRQIVKSASQNGFIKDDGSTFIAVTAETNNEQQAEVLEQEALKGAENAIESEDETATIETGKIGLDRRNEAIALGMTPGKLNMIQKLQSLDPTIRTEDYMDASVSEIQKKYVQLKKEHNGNNDKEGADITPSPSPSHAPGASSSPSPSPSPSAPTAPDKPGNGNHGGKNNGNNNAPAHGNNSNNGKNGNNGNNGNKGNNGNSYSGKNNGNNGKDNGG